MITTSLSLLDRLQSGNETQSWNRFVRLYTPVIYRWVRSRGIPASDSSDLVQNVFRSIVRGLPRFQRQSAGSFGRWLRTITTNKCRDYLRERKRDRIDLTSEIVVSDEDNVEAFTERDYQRSLARESLKLMQQEFEYTTWKAAWEHIVSGRSAQDIAAELNMSVNAVYVAKSRVLRRLREELDGLL